MSEDANKEGSETNDTGRRLTDTPISTERRLNPGRRVSPDQRPTASPLAHKGPEPTKSIAPRRGSKDR